MKSSPILALLLLSAPFIAMDPVTINSGQTTCTESACYAACVEYVNNQPWCLLFRAECRADNTCVCHPMCIVPGEPPHVTRTKKLEKRIDEDSCETRRDWCE